MILQKLFRLGVVSIALIIAFQTAANGQNQKDVSTPDLNIEMEFGTVISEEGELPFWLHSNRWGIIDRKSANGFVRLAPQAGLGTLGPVKLSAGAELVGRLSEDNNVFFNEGYLQADWQIFRFVAGRKKEQIGITDSTLTSGSMIQSGNASPVPKIRLYTPDWVGVPGTDNWLSFRGYFTHGWMGNGRYIDDPWLHQKYFYLKALPNEYPLQFYGGIVQSTLWAGTHPEYGNLPDGLSDFWNVFTAQESNAENAEPSATGEAVGSSIGIYDFGIEYDYQGFGGIVHRQFYLETGAGAKFRNVWDGLWGVSVSWDKKFNYINNVSWSHLYTKRQSSQEHRGDPSYGADGYYGNGIYRSGWTYYGRTIGNALLFSDGIGIGIDNNIVIAHQLGLGGVIEGVVYDLTVAYSRNYGSRRTVGFTGRQDQYSGLLQTSIKIQPKMDLKMDIAYDTGDLYANQLGGMVSVVYHL
ncbi:capsule assembly Wzi family protein [Fodinibius sp. SL11]|uniref:capsule assembly Wzi family protein n=1 Tax=Fodinibius sp. SL11 TaxID=3425690 RepID=UPI003F88346F